MSPNHQDEVVFIIDNFSGGGAERVVLTLADSLHRLGYSISAITLTDASVSYTVPEYVSISKTSDIELSAYHSWKVKLYRELFVLKKKILKKCMRSIGKETKDLLKESRCEIFAKHSIAIKCYLDEHKMATAIAFLDDSVVATCLIAKRVKNKVIFSERNDPLQLGKSRPQLCKLRDRYCRKADMGVFQTQEAAEYYHLQTSKSIIIPNPLREELPESFIGERRKVFVTLGRYNKQKNLNLLIEAFSIVHRNYPDYKLILYGHGPEEEYLRERIKVLNLEQDILMYDFCEDVLSKIRDATAYINSSDYEGISNAMLESMAIGLTVICTDCPVGGARTYINPHNNGLLVPVRDKVALSEAMVYIIEHPAEAAQMGKNAEKIRDICDRNVVIKAWEKII